MRAQAPVKARLKRTISRPWTYRLIEITNVQSARVVWNCDEQAVGYAAQKWGIVENGVGKQIRGVMVMPGKQKQPFRRSCVMRWALAVIATLMIAGVPAAMAAKKDMKDAPKPAA